MNHTLGVQPWTNSGAGLPLSLFRATGFAPRDDRPNAISNQPKKEIPPSTARAHPVMASLLAMDAYPIQCPPD